MSKIKTQVPTTNDILSQSNFLQHHYFDDVKRKPVISQFEDLCPNGQCRHQWFFKSKKFNYDRSSIPMPTDELC